MNKIIFRIYNILPVFVHNIWKKVQSSEIGVRIAKGAFWSLAGSVVSQALMLLAAIVVARILGKTEFGELGMIRSTVNMFAVFAGLGLGITATKYIAEFKLIDKIRTGKIIGLTTLFAACAGGFISISILIAAPYLAEKTIGAPQLANELRLGAIMIFFSSLNGAQTGALIGFEAFRTIAKINLVSGIISFPLQIACTMLFGLSGSVIGLGVNYLLLWILNFIAVRKTSSKYGISIRFKNLQNEWPVLYKFSLPALLSGLMVSPVMWACNAMLVNLPNGYDQMAIFDAVNQWRNALLFIPSILSQVALPLLSNSTNNQNQFNSILKVNIVLNFAVSFILSISIAFAATPILKMYGKGFEEGKTVLIIIIFTTVLISINSVIGQAIAGKGRMWIGFIFNLIWSIILLSSTYIFLKLGYGVVGMAYSVLISYICHTIVQSIFTAKYMPR